MSQASTEMEWKGRTGPFSVVLNPGVFSPTHTSRTLADALADDVFIAPSATCCAFAGDRGISHPELTASATKPQAEELSGRDLDAYLSSNRTCEIAMTRATGQPYESVVSLLERLTRTSPTSTQPR